MAFKRKEKSKPDTTRKKHALTPEMKQMMWKPGVSPNPAGRPKGSRNKLGEAFLSVLLEDFEAMGDVAIEECRKQDPARYCAIIASILPKDLTVNSEERLIEKFLEQFTTSEEISSFRKQLGFISARQDAPEEGHTPSSRR